MAEFRPRDRFRHIGERLWQRILPKLYPLVIAGLIFAGLVAIFHLAAGRYPSVLALITTFQSRGVAPGEGEALQRLFRRLVDKRLVAFDASTGELVNRVDCRAERSGFRAEALASDRELVNRLCDSDPGSRILAEMTEWNGSLAMLAIRDNFGSAGQDSTCDDKGPRGLFIEKGCITNRWAPALRLDNSDRPSDLRHTSAPPGEIYGFLARPPLPGFGDWQRIDTAAVGGRELTLNRRLPPRPQAGTVTIDIIGLAPTLQINGMDGDAPSLLCHGARTQQDCERLLRRRGTTPHAYRFTVPLVAGQVTLISLRVKAVRIVPDEIASLGSGLPGPITQDQRPALAGHRLRADQTAQLTRHIALVCQIDSAEDYEVGTLVFDGVPEVMSPEPRPTERAFCELDWQTRQTVPPARRGQVEISTGSDGNRVKLTEINTRARTGSGQMDDDDETSSRQEVFPSTEAVRLGLLPLVGIGEADRYSLIGQAVRQGRAGGDVPQIDLTIDPQLQAIALKQLQDDLPASDNSRIAPDSFAPRSVTQRRAGIVLIDAGQVGTAGGGGGFDARTGSVLAAAMLPLVPPNVSHWDLVAADRYRPTESLLAARGWAQNDRHFAPGSTFKTVVALAGIEAAARGDARVARALGLDRADTGPKERELESVFGRDYGFTFRATSLVVPRSNNNGQDRPPVRIGNFGNARLCSLTTASGPVPQPACSPTAPLNLLGAMTTSNNMWFARLALMLDENRLMRNLPDGGRIERRSSSTVDEGEPLLLRTVLNKVWSAGPVDLVPGFTSVFGRPPIAGARTYASGISLDSERPDRMRRVSLALNGIGQATQATPLAMASIMASIATGRVVRPRLTQLGGPRPDPLAGSALVTGPGNALLPSEQRAAELLAGLRGAMKNVVTVGTAAQAFQGSPLQGRVYAKTGTAQTGDNNTTTNTVWLVGWVEGLGSGELRERRVAFACVVSHIVRSETSAGGARICAPLIEKVLRNIDRLKGRT